MKVSAIPPRASGSIMAVRAGMDSTAYEVAIIPPKARPVAVYVLKRNLFNPTFLDIFSLVGRLESGFVSF
jgi:hypothetical protein